LDQNNTKLATIIKQVKTREVYKNAKAIDETKIFLEQHHRLIKNLYFTQITKNLKDLVFWKGQLVK
jgi:hypothetical protein